MVKNFIACAFAVFFMASFLACSNRPSPKEEKVSMTAAILPEWKKDTHGIWPHKDHKYGFDRHPDNTNKFYTIYASVLNGDKGFATIKINKFLQGHTNFDYYICDLNSPYPHTSIENLDDSKSEQTYTFTAKDEIKKIGLCFKSNAGTYIAHVMEIHPYEWQEYDFEAYIYGDSTKNNDRNQLIHRDEFWEQFNTVYAQALVRHNRKKLDKKYIHDDRGYILSRATGKYLDKITGKDTCIIGDIARLKENIFKGASYNNKKRAIIQVGYPTKKFWPLSFDENRNVKICGSPRGGTPTKLELESVLSSEEECKNVIVPKVSVFKADNNRWKYESGEIVKNINPKCVVFAEADTSSVVGEISDDRFSNGLYSDPLAIAFFGTNSSVAVLPWFKNDKTALSHAAFHELGHTMGLYDLNDTPLSLYNEKGSIENNLLHFQEVGGYKLRKRGIESIHKGIEYQWDCLQKNNINENCAHPDANIELH